MEIICWIIGFFFTIWLLVCPLICLYWVFKPSEWFCWKHKYISYAIGLGSFLGCAAIITGGVHFFLWFFPDGEIGFKARLYTAGAIGIVASFALWERLYQALKKKVERDISADVATHGTANFTLYQLLEKKVERDRENRICNHVQENINRLTDPLKLDLTLAEFRRRKQELEKLCQEKKLSPFQEEEWIALEKVWEKENLRKIIIELRQSRKERKLGDFGKKGFVELIQKLKEIDEQQDLEDLDEWEDEEDSLS